MAVIPSDSFKSPVVGVDPVTKGTFLIEWANILLDYDDEFEIENTRAVGSVLIAGYVEGCSNPLYDVIKANPLRIQGLLGSVMFGTEKMFVKFTQITDYGVTEDELIKEIDLALIFEVLDNLEYLEHITEYKRENSL